MVWDVGHVHERVPVAASFANRALDDAREAAREAVSGCAAELATGMGDDAVDLRARREPSAPSHALVAPIASELSFPRLSLRRPVWLYKRVCGPNGAVSITVVGLTVHRGSESFPPPLKCQDLDEDYIDRRQQERAERYKNRLIRELERVGHKVTLDRVADPA
jgi:hypothetical protein